ncbi:MAG: DUF1800 domain-containing protein [Bacteroidota bacterium]
MDRKEFLQSAFTGGVQPETPNPSSSQSLAESGSPHAQLHQRKLVRTTTGLGPYAGPWNSDTAAHLLRRTMFGPRRAEVLSLASGSMDAAIELLFAEQPDPNPPLGPGGAVWVDLPYDQTFAMSEQTYRNYLKAWWLGLTVGQGMSVREKMVLFWHNHFPSESFEVQDARAMYRQNSLFRRNAVGNFRSLVREVSVDPAMLYYLNGYLNRATAPDENYARELFELFTIGKGPQHGDGDYTNYTEQDVQAAAKVLTGYRLTGSPRDRQNGAYLTQPLGYMFDPNRHDWTNKQFSAAFQNRVLIGKTGTAGEQELDELIDMIFTQAETARFMCRKLYRWFVYYDIDENVEQNVVEPMAQILRANDYEIRPVLRALLTSEHFYDTNNIGCFIRTPMDIVAGSIRQLHPQGLPDLSQYTNFPLANSLRNTAANLGMNLFDPPDVAGWKAFYQLPDFYELWINTTTLPSRGAYTDALFNGIRAGTMFRTDPIAFVSTMNDPGDPFKLVDDLSAEFSPISLTQKQKDYLLYDVLGLVQTAEYEWTNRWYQYLADPGNALNRDSLNRSLSTLLTFLLRMAETQLA